MLAGGKEIVRQKLVGGATAEAAPAPAPPTVACRAAGGAAAVGGQLPPAKSDESRVDVAGFAYEAEHAKHADSVGGVTAPT
ncbi:MAG: hypothetical protein U1F43_23360 [Myxococcota bacterium]